MKNFTNSSSFLSPEEREAIAEIEAAMSAVQLITRLTKLKFAAIEKITEKNWVACSITDDFYDGRTQSGAIPPKLDLCREAKNKGQIFIYQKHKLNNFSYECEILRKDGFGGYISSPIVLSDGYVYGFLWAVAPQLSTAFETNETLDTLRLFSRLVASAIELQIRHPEQSC
ncbi:hypothetical protein DM05_1855 [Pseudomonas poae]|uniref:GAF domain-containing protein n=1 Tax=Pseudomonas poae TaxID=200451 RepID=A0A7Z1K3P1_9PSED|nr:GAF domain-containing protein [Pseudomonas poae]PFG71497.1 hypothetical protein DM05_1855 [Pseudomonas poae]